MTQPDHANAPKPSAQPGRAADPSAASAPTAPMMAATTVTMDAPSRSGAPPALPAVPKDTVCPICATRFDPRAAGGRCPVCGEQVVPAALVTRDVPGVSAAGRWLKSGGWRVVLLVLLIIYQIALFIYIWHSFVVNRLL